MKKYFVNSKMVKQTIYDIYRACRLCGGGAGYKMPIIQNVVNIDSGDIELKQKIRECVQIEVHQEDKMPPLICELCVDKVNDFYEFLEMCRQTNKKTRLRLGLPPQTMPKGAPDAGDCILGVTEPVFINREANESPSAKNKSTKTSKIKESEVKSEFNKPVKRESKELKYLLDSDLGTSTESTPTRLRGSKRPSDDNVTLSKLQGNKSDGSKPKSILKKNLMSDDDDSPLVPRPKRSRDWETKEENDDTKKVKISLPAKTEPRVIIKAMKLDPYMQKCKSCTATFKTTQALASHIRGAHRKISDRKPSPPPKRRVSPPPKRKVSPPPKRRPSPPSRRRSSPPPKYEEQCTDCKKTFATYNLLKLHLCRSKKPDLCKKGKKTFPSSSALMRHETTSGIKKKEWVPSPRLMRHVKPIQIRVARCDSLLSPDETTCDVSNVSEVFGLDKNSIYPYLYNRELKKDSMVKISDDIKDEFNLNDTAWDSDDSMDIDMSILNESNPTFVERLSRLALRAVYQARFLQKKKMREMREKPIDSMLKSSGSEIRHGISDIIKSLDDDNEKKKKDDNDNDSLLGDTDSPSISNNDFDSLFDSSKKDSDVSNKEKNESVNDKSTTENEFVNETNVDKKDEIESNDKIDMNVNDKESEVKNESDEQESVEENNKNDKINESFDVGAIDMSSNKNNINGLKVGDKHNLEDVIEAELDDKKLMEAIDAQIGESETKSVSSSAFEKDSMLEI